MKGIDCFIACRPEQKPEGLIKSLENSDLVNAIRILQFNGHFSTGSMRSIAEDVVSGYFLLISGDSHIEIGAFAI